MSNINESVAQMVAALRNPSGRAARFASADYRTRVAETYRQLIKPAFDGDKYARLDLQEAMSRSDFPILFGDVLYRQLAAKYALQPTVWQKIAQRKVVQDFRATKLIDILGGKGVLDDVAELAPYPRRALEETEIEMSVGKTGASIAWSWEMGVNDDLGAFRDLPDRLAQAARNTEDYKAAGVFATAAGPQAWLGAPATVPLNDANLQAAVTAVTDVKDEDDTPIIIGTPVLMVPQSLALTAQEIVDTVTVKTTSGGKEREVRGNGLTVTPEIVVNPWLTSIDKSAKAGTTWYLFAGPNSPRPAAFELFLNGNESPDIRLRNDAGVRPGGGAVDPTEGGFERDDVEYRIRHVVAGSRGFDDAVYVSTGS